jgi:hypothetical protein
MRDRFCSSRGFVVESLENRRMLSVAGFRPSAVPLLTGDPYFSVWSESNNLTDTNTVQWDGNTQELVSLIRIDGTTYRLMGDDPSTLAAFPQTSLTVTATRSIYTFSNSHVAVTMTFETAALPNNLDVLTRPLSYINWDVHSVDGLTHQVQIYDSSSSELTVSNTANVVQWGRATDGSLTVLHVGTVAQTLFSPAGDQVAINWGYLYESAGTSLSTQAIGGDNEQIAAFEANGKLGDKDDTGTRAVSNDQPVLAFSFALGTVGSAVVSRHVEVSYDELYEVNYFGENLLPYWKRDGETMLQLLATADSQYATLALQCATFDTSLNADLTTAGGAQYAQLAELAYRQALSATGIAADSNGQPLLFTKEETSNGDIATADVIFPTDPIFFLLNPTLAKASMVPLLAFAGSGSWTQQYAPHDLGTYPLAEGEPTDGEEQPVEEAGNMLIMVDTIAHIENSAEFADKYWGEMTEWAQYLLPYAYDPGAQLTTDDFLGTIQSSTNLAIKAIEALGAYAQMCTLRGDLTDAAVYRADAAADVTHLLKVATDGNHLRLGYYLPGTWSEDYNLVWDKILGINLFPASVAAEEVAYYKTVITPLGLQVESTNVDVKTDWATWTASLATNTSDFETLIAPEYNFINTTTDRKPLQDGYSSTNLDSAFFWARSVVGGLFIRMLEFPAIWSKYSSADTTVLTGWAPIPTATPVLPDAQTSAQTWLYTTSTPPANWTSQSFNDSSWSSGLGGFGTSGTPGAIVNTTWNTSNIYLRKSYTMPAGTYSHLEIQAYHDEDMAVYINGVLAVSAPGYITSYEDFAIAPAALALLTSGATVEIAVSCLQTTGGQDIDVGLVNLSFVAPVLPDALSTPQTWNYTTTTPASNWTSQAFDDSSWSSGLGGFGTIGTVGAVVGTVWSTANIYLRKSWTVPAGNFANLEIQAYHDEDMVVYIDGVVAASQTGYRAQYNLFTIAPAALALLTAGSTVEIAVSCLNTAGGQDIDVGIVNITSVTTPGVIGGIAATPTLVPGGNAVAQPGAAIPAANLGAQAVAAAAPPARGAAGGTAPATGVGNSNKTLTPLTNLAALLTPAGSAVPAPGSPVTNPVKLKPTTGVATTGLVAAGEAAIKTA